MATAIKAIPQLSALGEKHARPALSALLILTVDLTALMLAAGSSVWLLHQIQGQNEQLTSYWRLWPVLGIFISAYGLFGLYPGVLTSPVQELRRATEATTGVFLALL